LHKMDEMERVITLKSIRVSWIFIAMFLLGWGLKNYINGLGQTLPMVLFISQVVIVIISKYIYMIKVDDKESKGNLVKLVIIISILILAGYLLYYFKVGF
jgi:hypothetical protein